MLSQKFSAWVVAVLLPVAGWLAWKHYHRATDREPEAPQEEQLVFASEAPVTEAHWIVNETGRAIAGLLAYAKNAGGKLQWSSRPVKGKPQGYEFQAEIDRQPLTGAFQAKEHIWSPDDYSEWARALLAKWNLQAPPATKAPAEFLTNLAKATPAALQAESKRLAGALSQTPLDASLHEQAALVIASFALQEAAGNFTDTRRELSRIAAHLAVARAVQASASDSIRAFAECALQTLCGRETAALATLDSIPQEAAGSISWTRALRLRNTGDWRAEVNPGVLLETMEGFRARAASVNEHFAILWLEKLNLEPVPAWHRMVLEQNFGVEDGHGFAKGSIGAEIQSLQADWNSFHGQKLEDKDVIKALGEPSAGVVGPDAAGKAVIHVLGWDFWSA